MSQRDGRWWFTEPNGRPFWSFAVDCVGPGQDRGEYDPKNPGYSADRIYSNPRAWALETFGNLHKWGFNSLGGWSDVDYIRKYAKDLRLPYFEVLHLGAYAKAPFADIFTDEAKKAMTDAARNQIVKLREDPLLAGYFSDNELGWWGDTLFTSYMSFPSAAPGKQRLMAVVRRVYQDRFDALGRDWLTTAHSFDELDKLGKMKLRPGGGGMRLVNAWLSEMATYYYSLVHDAIRAYDQRHLILGDRYCQFYELPIAVASAPYLDVASSNFGATWNDGTIAHFFLDTLHEATRKPVVVTEFYMGATENRSGDPNLPPAFPVVATQKERAAAFLRNVQSFAKLPYVVGAHWFQYYDEPPKGRGDGESFDHGLVDIKGRPYEEMSAAAVAAQPEKLHAASRETPARSSVSVPFMPTVSMKELKLWPREAGFVSPASSLPFADMYVCSDKENFYLGVIEMEYMDEHLYEGGAIPESERPLLTLHLSGLQDRTLTVRFNGSARKASVSLPGVEASDGPGLQHTLLLKIPKRLFVSGSPFSLDATLFTHSRGHQMSWHASLSKLSARPTGVEERSSGTRREATR